MRLINQNFYKITYRRKFIFPFLYLRFLGFTKFTIANNEEEVRNIMWKMPFISNSANLNNYQVTVEEDYKYDN